MIKGLATPIISEPQIFSNPDSGAAELCLSRADRMAVLHMRNARTMPTPCPWRARVWREFHAHNLSRAYRDVLLTLASYRSHGGTCTPSHATLAERAGCSVRTVARALQQAQRLGLVTWAERRVRAAWRWLRTSNAYRMLMPGDPVQPGMRLTRRRRATTGQDDRGGESPSKKEALKGLLLAAARLPDLLALRRAAVEARLRGMG